MAMYKNLFLLAIFIVSLVVSSCSSDDEPKTNDSIFSVNNTKIGSKDIFYTVCEYNSLLGETLFEVNFKYDDDTYMLQISLPTVNSLEDLEVGDEFDADEFIIYKFYSKYSVFIGNEDYEPISGTVKVKSKSAKAIVMDFSNFKFRRELGSKTETFTITGSISYTIYN